MISKIKFIEKYFRVNTFVVSFFIFICMYGCITQCKFVKQINEKRIGNKIFKYKDYNLIFVCFDALQARHVHGLGYPKDITPTIDSMARSGFNFINAISASSWTVPSCMSWFTGVYPSQHKIVNKFAVYEPSVKKIATLKELSPHLVTLTEILKKNGYITAAFTGDAGVSGIFGFSQGFDVYLDDVKFGDMGYTIPKALEWIKENKDKKFFLFLHGYDVHGQCEPAEGYDYRYVSHEYDYKYKGTKKEQEALREEGLRNGKVELQEEDVEFWRAVYDEKINRLDTTFNNFLEAIKNLDLMKNTIFILTSDHGTEIYEHKRFDHGFSLYDELIHVPLIIKLPDQSRGKIIRDQISSIDIMPTILDLLDIKISKNIKNQLKGANLVPALKGDEIKQDVYSETDYRRYTYKRAIRTYDGWKLIYTLESKERELYDLHNDPGEVNNLVEKEPRIAYELEQKLFKHLKSMGQDVYEPWITGCYPVYDSQAPDYKP